VDPLPDAALEYLRLRRRLLVRLERVARARRRWDTVETNARLSEGRRRPVVRPGARPASSMPTDQRPKMLPMRLLMPVSPSPRPAPRVVRPPMVPTLPEWPRLPE
jgi:hypothetical protein